MGDIYFPHLNISIESLDRVAFSILGINIYWYGIFIALGAILGITLAFNEAKRTGQSQDMYSDFAFAAIIAGIIGARLYYIIFHGDSLLSFFKIREGGLAIYGGIIAGLITAIVFVKIKKINFLQFTDTVIMGLVVGQIFGRWGNFFNREAFGRHTDGLFAMALKADTVNGLFINGSHALYQGNVEYPVIQYGGVDYIQVHPTFLYESLWNLALLAIIFACRRHKKFQGQLVIMYCIGYGIGRFWIESLRSDQLEIHGIPISMIVSAVLVLAALAAGIILYLKEKQNNGVAAQKNQKSS